MPRQKLADLSVRSRGLIVTGAAVQIALLVAAQFDLTRRDLDEVRGSKRLWRVLAFVNFVGPLAYFRWGRRRTSTGGRGRGPAGHAP